MVRISLGQAGFVQFFVQKDYASAAGGIIKLTAGVIAVAATSGRRGPVRLDYVRYMGDRGEQLQRRQCR